MRNEEFHQKKDEETWRFMMILNSFRKRYERVRENSFNS